MSAISGCVIGKLWAGVGGWLNYRNRIVHYIYAALGALVAALSESGWNAALSSAGDVIGAPVQAPT